VQILRGKAADRIPIAYPSLTFRQVDWRQIRRWGISDARVPTGVRVMFQAPSVWDRYRSYILGGIALLLAQTGLIAALLFQRARRRRAEQQLRGNQAALQGSYERIRDLGSRLLEAQETERSRIARELHDDVGQQIASLEIDLDLLRRGVPEDTGALAGDVLNRAHQIARSVHDLSHRLHPAKLRLIGLVAALQGLQRELAQSGRAINVNHDNVPAALPPDLTLCIFRVVQEALQNAIKYSHAPTVSVHLAGVPGHLVLTISDDGVGFDVSRAWGKGLGLISMEERVESLGGTVEIRSNPGAGTRLEIVLPLQSDQESGRAVSA
jgi:signal transduction histidine kinase